MKVEELSVFFPAYNEEANIKETITKAIKILPQVAKKWEIIVINDGSTDRTGEIVEDLIKNEPQVRMITHTPNRGYGAAVKCTIPAMIRLFLLMPTASLIFLRSLNL
jgi:glycosyltransferase involved in cell wall biosynthesis